MTEQDRIAAEAEAARAKAQAEREDRIAREAAERAAREAQQKAEQERVRLAQAQAQAIAEGEAMMRRGMDMYRRCREADMWPGAGWSWDLGEYTIRPIGRQESTL